MRLQTAVQDWAQAIEHLGVAKALKASFVAYPLVNAAHILAIGALVTSVILMDLRLLGGLSDLPERTFVRRLRAIALGAFAVAAGTGVAMFTVRASDYAATPLYWAKMTLILLAGVNFLVFSLLDRQRKPGAALPWPARLSAALSIVLWPCILVAGRFLGFV